MGWLMLPSVLYYGYRKKGHADDYFIIFVHNSIGGLIKPLYSRSQTLNGLGYITLNMEITH
jgi:hypothetical protein